MKGRLALAGAALLLCGCAAQIESPRVVDKRRRQMGRGLSHDQKLGMKALSDQGLTAQQIQEQMQIEKTQDEIVEIVKSVKAADMTLFGREGRSDLSSWNKDHREKGLWGVTKEKDKPPRQASTKKVSRRFKPARQMKHADLPKHDTKRPKGGKYRGAANAKGKPGKRDASAPKTRLGVSRESAAQSAPPPPKPDAPSERGFEL